jgi:endonuclease/exonuclease/phosphatase (EEP) superfamily protein YafD
MKVLTLNMGHNKNNFGRTIDVIKQENPDLCLLQEGMGLGFYNNIKRLGSKTGYYQENILMHGRWFWNWRVGILSKIPIRGSTEIELGVYDCDEWGPFPFLAWRRSILMAWLEDGTRVISLHLGFEKQQEQIDKTLACFDKYFPSGQLDILAGDFNMAPNSVYLEPIRAYGFKDVWAEVGIGDGYTFIGSNYKIRCDYIWYRGDWQPTEASLIEKLSDHHGVMAW